jgi:hypothetical protein
MGSSCLDIGTGLAPLLVGCGKSRSSRPLDPQQADIREAYLVYAFQAFEGCLLTT